MYDYIIGKITKITPSYIVVETGGVGYLVNVANPYSFSQQLNRTAKIFVHQVVREEAHLLYGFAGEEEKVLFLRLIGVTGIGPKSALAIIARADNVGLVTAIEGGDITYLTKFPGVGKKTASQMVLDLAGKFTPESALSAVSTDNTQLDEAIEALQALGYKAIELRKIRKTLETADENQTAESYIKQALKMMVK